MKHLYPSFLQDSDTFVILEEEENVSYDIDEDAGWLTTLFQQSGYFIAGGLAGMVSRTATAPLDRLKVYLIAQTSNTSEALEKAKDGSPAKAAKSLGRPLVNALKELWAAGGIRSLFAGMEDVSVATER